MVSIILRFIGRSLLLPFSIPCLSVTAFFEFLMGDSDWDDWRCGNYFLIQTFPIKLIKGDDQWKW